MAQQSNPSANSPEKHAKKRRSQRLGLSIPVVAYKLPKTGRPFFEGAYTIAVSAHGALISLATEVAPHEKLFLKHALSGQEQECRIIFVQKQTDGPTHVAIEFARPAPEFWGIAFSPADWRRR
jgi:hypothetical protein